MSSNVKQQTAFGQAEQSVSTMFDHTSIPNVSKLNLALLGATILLVMRPAVGPPTTLLLLLLAAAVHLLVADWFLRRVPNE